MTTETSDARGEWVLVPRNPTEAMIDAWRDAPDIWEDAYAAMLAAAPPPAGDADVWLFKGTDGAWHTFHNEQHRLDTIADGRWDVRKFYALPPPADARGDVRYDRELIAQMLDAAEAPAFTMEEMDTQARLLREAAQAKPEARGVVDEGSRSVTSQLLHWGGIPVRVTGTVTTSPGNWPLIDAALTETRNVR